MDELLQHLSKDWKDDDIGKNVHHSSPKNVAAEVETSIFNLPTASIQPHGVIPSLKSKVVTTSEQAPDVRDDRKLRDFLSDDKRVVKQTSSCPPCQVRSTSSGPWSLEWVSRHRRDKIGASFKSKSKAIGNSSSQGVPKAAKKKGSGYLRHCA